MPKIPNRYIGIVGSRRRDSDDDFELCLKQFENIYKPGDRIVSGGCSRGGDRFAETITRLKGLTITIHYADWNGIGKPAGFVRNTKIATDCDILIALVAEDRSGGAEDTVRKALALGKEVILL